MGILFALIAGAFFSLVNLTTRKSVDVGGSTKIYFIFQMAASFLFAVLFGPVRQGDFSIPVSAIILGTTAGLLLSIMLFALGRAVEKGPPGLTFAILSSATVMPGLIMASVFGEKLGFIFNAWHGLGSLFVLAGLFWAGKGLQGMKEINKWLFFATAMFIFHMLLLSLFQWRAMVMKLPNPEELISFFSLERAQSEWFAPFMFLSCGIVQFCIYLRSERQKPKMGELIYGVAGGVLNFLCTFFIIRATIMASPLENAVIFPIYSILGIILTNLWGQKLYQEQVNWRACQLCAFGLLIGTVDWKAVAAVIGY